MNDQPYQLLNTIAASCLSRCTKWLLTSLIIEAAGSNSCSCTICLDKLSRLTSTSTRHLSRLISQLSTFNLIKINRKSGKCNTYILPSSLELKMGTLRAIFEPQINDRPDLTCHLLPGHDSKQKKDWVNPDLVKSWSAAFSEQYQPVTEQEQTAMDFMLFAKKKNKIRPIDLPVAYLKALVRNGHSNDFIKFSEVKAEVKKQNEVRKIKNKKLEKDKEHRDKIWQTYNKLPKSRKKNYKKRFGSERIGKEHKIIGDIYRRDGFNNAMITALYRDFIENLSP